MVVAMTRQHAPRRPADELARAVPALTTPDDQAPALDVPEVLTVPEFATALRVSPATIRNWIAQGTVVALNHGGRHYRIPRSELDRMLRPTRSVQ